MSQLIINSKYAKMIPAISIEEYNTLKESIKKYGLWIPIIINKSNVILDGHNRYRICKELGIKIKHAVRTFTTKLDEEIFVLECNVKRRQLDDLGKHKIYEKLKPLYELRAKERQGTRTDLDKSTCGTNVPKVRNEKTRATSQAAQQVNLSPKKAQKMDYVKEQDPKLYEQIGKTDKITVNKAYTIARKNEKREQRNKEIKKLQVNLPDTITLYNQDFRKVPIPENSISLIWTDPPYDKKSLPLYEDLAKQAAFVLRDGGSLLCYAGHYALDRIITMMKNHGLTYQWCMCIIHTGAKAHQHGPRVKVGHKPILWFVKGKYTGEYLEDTVVSKPPDKKDHEWAQSTVESDYYIEHMTIPNEIIYDPFLGSGTTGISAKKLNRKFIGCEDNSKDENDYFTIAQKRISNA